MTEAISNGSRRLGLFLAKRIKAIDEIIAAVEAAVETVRHASHDGEYLVNYALKHASDEPIYAPSAYQVDLDRHYRLNDLRHNLEAMRNYGTAHFLQYAAETLNNVEGLDDTTRAALALMPQLDAGFHAYGFAPGDQDYDDYRDARALGDAYLVILRCLEAVERIRADLKSVFADLQKRQEYQYQADKYRPDHAEIETLYHATIFATEIMRDGFAAEKPADREGVGNYGTQQTISFTHDIKIAHDIMRALREMWMIVHGQLTRRQILDWMRVEGISAKDAAHPFVSSREPVDTPEQVIRLYRGYLGLSKLRGDPVFVSPERLIPILRDRSIRDIGIISCPVRLDGEESYLHGEAEFRVTASRVVGPIKRVA